MTPSQVREQEAAAREAYFRRMGECIRELIEGYAMLQHLAAPEVRGVQAGSRGAASGPGVPIDLEVVDLARNVDWLVDDVMPKAYGALRMGFWTPQQPARRERTLDALRWLQTAFRTLYLGDETTGEYIAVSLWGACRDVARRTTKTGPTPYRSARPCAECGVLAVVVDPARGARCTACRGRGVSTAT